MSFIMHQKSIKSPAFHYWLNKRVNHGMPLSAPKEMDRRLIDDVGSQFLPQHPLPVGQTCAQEMEIHSLMTFLGLIIIWWKKKLWCCPPSLKLTARPLQEARPQKKIINFLNDQGILGGDSPYNHHHLGVFPTGKKNGRDEICPDMSCFAPPNFRKEQRRTEFPIESLRAKILHLEFKIDTRKIAIF